MKSIYIDIDDTLVETKHYLYQFLKSNGLSPKRSSIYEYMNSSAYRGIFKEALSDYSLIPFKVGAKENLDLLKTEYSIILCSGCVMEYEKKAKQDFAKSLNLPIVFCEGDYWNKSSIDMSGAILVDDSPLALNLSNADIKLQIGHEGLSYMGIDPVLSWYDVTERLIGVDDDEFLRKYLSERVQRCCKASEQINK